MDTINKAEEKELSEADYTEIGKKGLEDLLFFCQEILGYKDMTRELHGEIIKKCEKAEEIGKYFQCIIPRDHFKSSLMSIAKPLWHAIKNGYEMQGIVSDTTDTSAIMVRKIRSLATSPMIEKCYPWFKVAVGTSRQNLIFSYNERILCDREANIMCWGGDSNRTGFRLNRLYMDDLVTKGKSSNEVMIERPKDVYRECVPMLVANGMAYDIGTRYTSDDLHGWLSDGPPGEDWISYKREVETNGKFILPKRYNADILAKKRRQIDDDCFFFAQYYNEIIPSTNTDFNKDWIRYADMRELFSTGYFNEMPKWVFVDPAWTQTKKSDDTAVNVVARDDENVKWVIESRAGRITPKALIKIIFDMHKKYNNPTFYVEGKAYSSIIRAFIEEESKKRGIHITLKAAEHKYKKKELRIRRLIGPLSSGKYIFDRSQTTLIRQIIGFPSLSKDDAIDCLAYAEQYIKDSDDSFIQPGINYPYLSKGWLEEKEDEELKKADKPFILRN